MPDAAVLATLFLLLGLFLLGLEFFIPSFGMILAVASVALVVSFWSACKAWWGVNPGFFWTYILVLIAGIPGSLLSAITIMQKTSFGNRMILRPPPPVEKHVQNPLDEMIGLRGTTQTLLTPGGMVSINSERFHAESLGMLIEPHTPVVVVATRSNRIVVRPLTTADVNLTEPGGADPLKEDSVEKYESPSQRTLFNPSSSVAPFEQVHTEPPKVDPTADHITLPAKSTENGDRLDFEIPDDYTQTSER